LPAACAVWDSADTHLLATYGFCQQYTYDKKGNIKTLSLFVDINNWTLIYTFSHPTGLLFATQFTQIALVVIEKAAFDDMCSKGFIQKGSTFASHSLGFNTSCVFMIYHRTTTDPLLLQKFLLMMTT